MSFTGRNVLHKASIQCQADFPSLWPLVTDFYFGQMEVDLSFV